MGFDEGRLILDKSNFTYFAGETLTGRIEFQQDKKKTFRGIYVSVKGSAHTHWRTSHTRRVNGKSETYHVNHDGNEEYFNYKHYLVGSNSGDYNLNPGKYSYPFQCQIPANCPSSFEGQYGHIRYKVKVVVDRAFKTDQEKEIDIRVFAPLDLSHNPHLREPMEMEFDDSYCCWCMSAGNVTTQIKVPSTGFCPGQVVPVEVHCRNKSSVEITKIKLAIKRAVVFHAHHESGTKHSDSETILEVKKGSVAGDTTRNWAVDMELPPDMPYNIANCHIIEMRYYFKVTVVPSGCHSNSEQETDIVIGSIPLQNFIPNSEDTQTNLPVTAFPNTNPYPPSYPGSPQNPEYPPSPPGVNPPYPGSPHSPAGAYPPVVGQPPTGIPYPAGNMPYPNPSFPGSTPYPNATPLYPGSNPPYPVGGNVPYPSNPPPYQFPNPPNLGFVAQDEKQNSSIPLLPPGVVPMPVPYDSWNKPKHAPSAPAPVSPQVDEKPSLGSSSPYNPEFMQNK